MLTKPTLIQRSVKSPKLDSPVGELFVSLNVTSQPTKTECTTEFTEDTENTEKNRTLFSQCSAASKVDILIDYQ